MEVFDPSQVKVSNTQIVNSSNNQNQNTIDETVYESDEINVKNNSFEIDVNGSSFAIENVNDSVSNSEDPSISIDTSEFEIGAIWDWFTGIFTIKLNNEARDRVIEFRNNNPNKTFRISATFKFKKVKTIDWNGKYLSTDNNKLFKIKLDPGTISGDKIECDFTRNDSYTGNELFDIKVGLLFIPDSAVNKDTSITITALTPNVQKPRVLIRNHEQSTSNTNPMTDLYLYDKNGLVMLKLDNQGNIFSRTLNLLTPFSNIEMDGYKIDFKMVNESVFKIGIFGDILNHKPAISIHKDWLDSKSTPVLTLGLNKDNELTTSLVTSCVVKIENGNPSIVKSRNVDSVLLENNLIKINFRSKVDIHFPHIQFHSDMNSNPTFKVASDLTNPVESILLSPSSLENGTLYLKFD